MPQKKQGQRGGAQKSPQRAARMRSVFSERGIELTPEEAAFVSARTNPFGEDGADALNRSAHIPDGCGAMATTMVLTGSVTISGAATTANGYAKLLMPGAYDSNQGNEGALGRVITAAADPAQDCATKYTVCSQTGAHGVLSKAEQFRVVGMGIKVWSSSSETGTAGVVYGGNTTLGIDSIAALHINHPTIASRVSVCDPEPQTMKDGITVRWIPNRHSDVEFRRLLTDDVNSGAELTQAVINQLSRSESWTAQGAKDSTSTGYDFKWSQDEISTPIVVWVGAPTTCTIFVQFSMVVELVFNRAASLVQTTEVPFSPRLAEIAYLANNTDIFPWLATGHSFHNWLKRAVTSGGKQLFKLAQPHLEAAGRAAAVSVAQRLSAFGGPQPK